ncbi:MAG: outer membrane protein assembly factor BamB family protein, partial [Planctomycetota bacterium]
MRKSIADPIQKALVLLGVLVICAPLLAADEAALVDRVIESGITRGLCCVLGDRNGNLTLELAGKTDLLIHVWEPDASAVETVRASLDARGLIGKRVIIEKGSLAELPYADNLVDLILAAELTDETLNQLAPTEVLRDLCPNGQAILGGHKDKLSKNSLKKWQKAAGLKKSKIKKDKTGVWLTLTKPPLQGTDDWSHWEHGPDNNPVSTDQVIKAPYMTQWLGLPYYITMPSITIASNGKIFMGMGHIAHHKREEPALNKLVARNGYNGTVLWTKKLPDGYLAHRSAFIATPDAFYMIDLDGTGCLILDPDTGEAKDRINIDGVSGEWKWMALQDDVLYALVGQQKDPPETTIVRSQHGHWSWRELSNGYYTPQVTWGFGNTLVAYDVDRDKVRWIHEEDKPIDSRAMVLGGGCIYLYGPDSYLRCLDARKGKIRWTNDDPKLRELIEQMPTKRLGSTPGWKSMCYALYTPKALFYEAQTRNNIVAVSLEDGSYLWHRNKTTNNPNMLYLDGNLLVGIGEHGKTLVLNPLTGKTIEDLGFAKAGCTRLTATPDSLFTRGTLRGDGMKRYDRITKELIGNAAARPACNDGVIGANGMLYFGPWACDCNLSLMGRVALCSAGDFEFDSVATETERLQTGPGDIHNVAPLEIADNDWPTYRGNLARSSSNDVVVPWKNIAQRWYYHPSYAYSPTAPTAAGGLIFLAGDDSIVRAFHAANGQLKWSYATAGPILQPPTIWNGRAYVGSGDGYIYALEAATGRLLWRFRAAPIERRIMVYGHLSSTWPVHTGVLVKDGIAYAAAGIIDYDGTYVYALDAVTGKIKWQNNSSGHLNKRLRKGVSAQGGLTMAHGRLWMAGGNVVSPAAYDLKTGEYLGSDPGDGSPRANRGEEIGVIDNRYLFLGGRLQHSARQDVVNPGRFNMTRFKPDGGLAGSKPVNLGKIPPAWNDKKVLIVKQRHALPACCDMEALEEYFVKGDPKQKKNVHPGRWQPTWLQDRRAWEAGWMHDRETVALALAKNVALAVNMHPVSRPLSARWRLSCLNVKKGQRVWEQILPGQPLVG